MHNLKAAISEALLTEYYKAVRPVRPAVPPPRPLGPGEQPDPFDRRKTPPGMTRKQYEDAKRDFDWEIATNFPEYFQGRQDGSLARRVTPPGWPSWEAWATQGLEGSRFRYEGPVKETAGQRRLREQRETLKDAVKEAMLVDYYKAAVAKKKKPPPEPGIRPIDPSRIPKPNLRPIMAPNLENMPPGGVPPPQAPRRSAPPVLPPATFRRQQEMVTPRPPVRANPAPPPIPPSPGGRPTNPNAASWQQRLQDAEARLKEAERRAEEARRRLEQFTGGGGAGLPPADAPDTAAPASADDPFRIPDDPNWRGTPMDGVYPYYRGKGPTKRFKDVMEKRATADLRARYPQHFYADGRPRPIPPGLRWDDGSDITFDDYVMFGGTPQMSATERRAWEQQQKQRLQQQAPHLYGAPGTPFRDPSRGNPRYAPRSPGANPPRGYAPPDYSGPFGANQRALDSLQRFQQMTPPTTQRGGTSAPPTGPRARRR